MYGTLEIQCSQLSYMISVIFGHLITHSINSQAPQKLLCGGQLSRWNIYSSKLYHMVLNHVYGLLFPSFFKEGNHKTADVRQLVSQSVSESVSESVRPSSDLRDG